MTKPTPATPQHCTHFKVLAPDGKETNTVPLSHLVDFYVAFFSRWGTTPSALGIRVIFC